MTPEEYRRILSFAKLDGPYERPLISGRAIISVIILATVLYFSVWLALSLCL